MERRKFVQVTSLVSLGVFLPFSSCNNSQSELENILSLPISLSYILDKDGISQVGKAYKIKKPEESNAKLLKKILMGEFENESKKKLSHDATLIIDYLLDKINEDFKLNRIIELNGWILSETEARQCALFSTIHA
jgi:hypothetical protein